MSNIYMIMEYFRYTKTNQAIFTNHLKGVISWQKSYIIQF